MVPPSAPPAGSAFGVVSTTVETSAALDGVDMQVERRKELLTPKKKMAEKRLQAESDGEYVYISMCIYYV